MRLKTITYFLLAAGAAALAPPAAAQAQRMPQAEVAERIGGKSFEFRSRYLVWRFAQDGTAKSEYNTTDGTWGASNEQWNKKASGTWRRDGDRICVTWQGAREECYAVMLGQRGMVVLSGPKMIEGTLEGLGSPGYAETPPRTSPQDGTVSRGSRYYYNPPGAR